MQSSGHPLPSNNPIVIGFVNNMPDAALRSSERQFRGLLQSGAGGLDLDFRGFFFPEIPRTDAVRETFLQSYCDIGALWDSQIDGLIVTGAEPRAANLTNEPYWRSLELLVEWAESQTISTIWSCLAAHAAVFTQSGLARRHLGKKLSGLIECSKALDHPLMADVPRRWQVPHSRYNDLPEEGLLSCGYLPLTRLANSGIDIFASAKKSLFLFFQGHPEYDSESLILEYIRDIKRFIDDEQDAYPSIPQGYFDQEMVFQLEELRGQILRHRDPGSLTAITRALKGCEVQNVWRSPGKTIYQNWLAYIAGEKAKRTASEQVNTRAIVRRGDMA
jgi:homoserine O-succinyltransferase/O-acetyltransferase